MILLDGKKLAQKIKDELYAEYTKVGHTATLAIVQVGSNPVSEKFIRHKQKLAKEFGVRVILRHYGAELSGSILRKRLAELAHDDSIDGIVVQLPLPSHMHTQDILNAVPPQKDVDCLSARAIGDFAVGKSKVIPPVVGAIDVFFREYKIEYATKQITIVGAGRLVGKPVADWFSRQGVGYTLCTEKTSDLARYTEKADIIISGVGKANLITGNMVKDGVVIIDAGTSESEGRLVGDIDWDSVSTKASFITPVPGGIGPLTVVMIFKNLVGLIQKKSYV